MINENKLNRTVTVSKVVEGIDVKNIFELNIQYKHNVRTYITVPTYFFLNKEEIIKMSIQTMNSYVHTYVRTCFYGDNKIHKT